MAHGSEKVVIVAALGNGTIATAKFRAVAVTGSSAIRATYPEIKRIYFETGAFKQQGRSRDAA